MYAYEITMLSLCVSVSSLCTRLTGFHKVLLVHYATSGHPSHVYLCFLQSIILIT
jgi:hypothetical protein